MNLKSYIQSSPGNAKRLSSDLGISMAYLSQMSSGLSAVSPSRAVAIERATDGRVTRKDLRSDWADIWPELQSNGKRRVVKA